MCRQEAEDCRKAAAAAGQEAEALQAALRKARGVLAQRRADASARSSQSAVVQALLAARASGDIPGIHGRLGRQAFPHLRFFNRAHSCRALAVLAVSCRVWRHSYCSEALLVPAPALAKAEEIQHARLRRLQNRTDAFLA